MENAPPSDIVLPSWSDFPIHREEWILNSDLHYLNHGAFGATPYPVFADYQRWQTLLEENPSKFFLDDLAPFLNTSRAALATFLGTREDNLALLTNSTLAMNIIGKSISLGPEDEVLLTTHEYGAIARTWRYLAKHSGCTLRFLELSEPFGGEQALLDLFQKAMSPRTKICVIDHITSSSSLIFPVEKLSQLCRGRGILSVIDGAHAPGQIELNLEALNVDFYFGNLHKWLCAPKGSAFLFVSPERQSQIEPLIVSWAWNEGQVPKRFFDLIEVQGTRDVAALLAIPAALEFRSRFPWQHLSKICHETLVGFEKQALAITGQPSLYQHPDSFPQMISLTLPPVLDAGEIRRSLSQKFKVEVAASELPGCSVLRVSLQFYNSAADLEAFLQSLTSEVETRRYSTNSFR